jgi:hypothetical protein
MNPSGPGRLLVLPENSSLLFADAFRIWKNTHYYRNPSTGIGTYSFFERRDPLVREASWRHSHKAR